MNADASLRRRQHAAEYGEQRRLAAARWSHQERQLTAGEREAYALQGLHLARPDAEEFHDFDRLDHRLGHCRNTRTGSIRITCTMAPMAEATHISTVSRNRAKVSSGVIRTGNAVRAVVLTIIRPIDAAREKPITALISAWQTMTLWIYQPDDPMARKVANSLRWSLVLE